MIKENIHTIQLQIPSKVQLVVVSKTVSQAAITEAYETGVRNFAENKVQELVAKYEALPKDIQWHFIGHLQSNKIKYIAPFIYLIHGVDSLKLLQEINKEAIKNNRIIPCLLQIYIAKEETKFGLSVNEVFEILFSTEFADLHNIELQGVMGMATYTPNQSIIRKEFAELFEIFTNLKNKFFANQSSFSQISMGMSQDFTIAIEEGSTMVRIGSSIFGARY